MFSMLDKTGFYAPSVAHNALPGHGGLGKEKSSHGGRVSTVSSSIKNVKSIIRTAT